MGSTLRHMLRVGMQARSPDDIRTVLPFVLDKNTPSVDSAAGQPLRIAWSDDCSGLPLSGSIRNCFASFRERLAREHVLLQLRGDSFDFGTARMCFIKLLYGALSASLPWPVVLLKNTLWETAF